MAKMATWSEINSKLGSSGTPSNKCPIRSEIEETGKGTVSESVSTNQLVDISQVSKSLDRVDLEFAVAGRWNEIREAYIDGVYFDPTNPVSTYFDVSAGLLNISMEITPNFNNSEFAFNAYIMGLNDIQTRISDRNNCHFVLDASGNLDITGVVSTDFQVDIISKCSYQGVSLNLIISLWMIEPV